MQKQEDRIKKIFYKFGNHGDVPSFPPVRDVQDDLGHPNFRTFPWVRVLLCIQAVRVDPVCFNSIKCQKCQSLSINQ